MLNIVPTLYEGYIVSVHRMVMENRPVDPGSIQGSHRPISFIRIEHRTRANDILCKTEYCINNHIVRLVHKKHTSKYYTNASDVGRTPMVLPGISN